MENPLSARDGSNVDNPESSKANETTKGDPVGHPLAFREIKRRRKTDFIYDANSPFSWHPLPIHYIYPPLTNFFPQIQQQSEQVPSQPPPIISLPKKSSPKITPKLPVSAQTSVSLSSRRGVKKRKDLDLDFSVPASSEEETSPTQISKQKGQLEEHLEGGVNVNVKQIIQAIKSLGGKGTGAEITAWIDKHCAETGHNKKRLGYTVNSVLSAKKYSILFAKETVIIDGNKRALWKLASGQEHLSFEDSMVPEGLIGQHEAEPSPTELKSAEIKEEMPPPKMLEFGGFDPGLETEEEDETDVDEKNVAAMAMLPLADPIRT